MKKADKKDDNKSTDRSLINDKFKFLEFIHKNSALFTVLGVFGAIAIYLNSLIGVNNINYNIALSNITSNNTLFGNSSIVNGSASMNFTLLPKEPNGVLLDPIKSFILNMGTLSTLSIFILLGAFILFKFHNSNCPNKHKYSQIIDIIYEFLLASLIAVVSIYVLYSLLFNNDSYLLVLAFVSLILVFLMFIFKPQLIHSNEKELYLVILYGINSIFIISIILSLIVSFLFSILLIAIKLFSLSSFYYLYTPIINGIQYIIILAILYIAVYLIEIAIRMLLIFGIDIAIFAIDLMLIDNITDLSKKYAKTFVAIYFTLATLFILSILLGTFNNYPNELNTIISGMPIITIFMILFTCIIYLYNIEKIKKS